MSHVTNTLCLYYAPLSTIGNSNDTTAAAAITAAFTHVVLSAEGSADVPNTQVILDAARDINPDLKVFGHTTLGSSVDVPAWEAQVQAWATDFGPTSRFPLSGIFIDQFGPDFPLGTRPNQNAAVTYLHQMGYSAFVNATSLMAAFGPDPVSNLQPILGTDRQMQDFFLLENVFQDHVNTQTKEATEHLRGRLAYAAWAQQHFNVRAGAVLGGGAGMTLVPWQVWRSTVALVTSYGIGIYGIGDADYGATYHTYWLLNQANEGPPPWPVWCRQGGRFPFFSPFDPR